MSNWTTRAAAVAAFMTFSAAGIPAEAITVPHYFADASKLLELSTTSCYMGGSQPYVVRTSSRDSLRYQHYFDASPAREVAVAVTDYNQFRVAFNIEADWQLSRYSTDDSLEITLSHLSPPLVLELSSFHLRPPRFTPDTMRGIRLDDPVSRVFAIFGRGMPARDSCGRTHYIFGWEAGQGARDTIDYEIRGGRIVSIQSASGCCGILRWAKPR